MVENIGGADQISKLLKNEEKKTLFLLYVSNSDFEFKMMTNLLKMTLFA